MSNIEYVDEKDIKLSNFREGLSICCVNAWSLINKFSLFELFVWKLNTEGINPDIICVSETFFSEDILMSQYNLTGYNSCHYFRPTGRRGGGVSIYFKESLRISDDIIKRNCNDVQFLLLKFLDFDMHICAVYRPPTSIFSVENDFLELMDEILSYNNLVILGDFNIDLLQNNTFSNMYRNLLSANNFITFNQIATEFSTRSDGNSSSILDHVHTNLNSSDNYNFKFLLFSNSISDHKSLILLIKQIKISQTKHSTDSKYSKRNSD